MENLAIIFALLAALVVVEIGGLFLRFSVLRKSPRFCSVWPIASVGMTLTVSVISAFELYFIGISSLVGFLFILGPVAICVAISWISLCAVQPSR
jgi:hypothetical protein